MIKIKNISKIYNKGKFNEFIALKSISCQIETGSWTTVVGASGSGKSTLLKCLSGLERISAGEIYLDEEKISELSEKKLLLLRKNKISFIFQDYNLIEDLKMIENIFLDTKLQNEKNNITLYRATETGVLSETFSNIVSLIIKSIYFEVPRYCIRLSNSFSSILIPPESIVIWKP